MVIRVKCMHIPTQQMFPTYRMFHAVPLAPTLRMFHAVPLVWICNPEPDPADVRLRAVGLDLQSRPVEYKDFQSAKAMN